MEDRSGVVRSQSATRTDGPRDHSASQTAAGREATGQPDITDPAQAPTAPQPLPKAPAWTSAIAWQQRSDAASRVLLLPVRMSHTVP
jgi:hypothetical protein